MSKIKIPNQFLGPFPAVLAGAQVRGKPNFTPIGACGVISHEPYVYIALRNIHQTYAGVKETGWYSINLPNPDIIGEMDYLGTVSGKNVDKSTVFTSFYDPAGAAPMIQECRFNILCKVIRTVEISDFEVFFGEMTATYVNEDCLTNGKPDPAKIRPMILAGISYWGIGEFLGNVFQQAGKYKRA